MRGVTRSFWALAIVLGAVEGYFVYLALASLHRVLPCWWGFIPHPANSFAACGERVVLFGANSWVPAAVILAVFLASTLLATWALVSQLARTRRAIHGFPVSGTKPAHVIQAEIRLGTNVTVVEDSLCFCCCVGSLRPRVIVSLGMTTRLDTEELTAVLAHELEHAKRRDPARAVAVRAAARALFYVPLAGYLAKKSLVAAELGADSSAVAVAGHDALIQALLRVLGEVRPALGSATEMASLDSLDQRIEALRTKRLPRVRPPMHVVLGTLLAFGIMWGFADWLPPAPPGLVVVHSSTTPQSSEPPHSRP
jgi:hypothetical protein